MGISNTYILLIVLFCYVIVYISLKQIIDYFNPNNSIYLNMYSIYYICFIVTLLLAISCNYYINEDNVTQITGLDLTTNILPVIPPAQIIESDNIIQTAQPIIESEQLIQPAKISEPEN